MAALRLELPLKEDGRLQYHGVGGWRTANSMPGLAGPRSLVGLRITILPALREH